MMNAREKSDSVIVAGKSSNKANQPEGSAEAETMERRTEAKENAKQQSMRRAQNRESVKQALDRVRKAARQRKKEGFTTLFHHITVDLLRLSSSLSNETRQRA
jgi:NADH:ubiquinone oxidoreductase subunit C